MLFRNITIVDENFDVKPNMFVGVKGKKIAYVGETEPRDASEFGDAYDGKDRLLIPGFVNTHAHTSMTLLRGYGEGMKLQDWLFTKIFPFEDQWYDEAVYWATMLGLAESAKAGITSTTDMYFWMKPISEAFLDSGSKGNLGRSISASEGVSFYDDPRWKDVLAGLEYNGADDGRILTDLAAHSEYTTRQDTIEALANEAVKRNLRMQVHVSETRFEHDNCIQKYGKTPTAYLADLGLYDVPTVAAHCVYCDANDREIMRIKGAFAATNPISNCKLASGIFDYKAMKESGVSVTLGTDSVSSNNSLNFLEEMKAFSMLAKVKSGDPTLAGPKEVLEIATRKGALSQGRTDCGLIKEGFRADLVAIDISGPAYHPAHDLLANLVYSGDNGDIRMTMVDGKVIYENGDYKTMDLQKVIAEAEKATQVMKAAVNR